MGNGTKRAVGIVHTVIVGAQGFYEGPRESWRSAAKKDGDGRHGFGFELLYCVGITIYAWLKGGSLKVPMPRHL